MTHARWVGGLPAVRAARSRGVCGGRPAQFARSGRREPVAEREARGFGGTAPRKGLASAWCMTEYATAGGMAPPSLRGVG